MHALRSLRAHSNNLESLPTSVGGLVSLELCDLGSNRHVFCDPPRPFALNVNASTAKAVRRIFSINRRSKLAVLVVEQHKAAHAVWQPRR